jgi:plasmid replication initiation protein
MATALAQAGQGDFFLCDIFGAAPKDDLASMEHPLFSLATRPDLRVRTYAHNGTTITVTPSVRGRATIHDKDILIYCISQLMAALNAGRAITRTLRLTAHDLLIATRRDTGGDAYLRLVEAFERLAGTRITTNLTQGGLETTAGFGLIEAWEVVRKSPDKRKGGGRMISVSVTLSDWLFRAVTARAVLTLSRDYFGLRKPLERRVYELARKHCGGQADWRVGLATLQLKCGSDAPLRVFRAAIRRMIADAGLPDYRLEEAPGDIIRVVRTKAADSPQAPLFGPATIDRLRALAPGWDPYALIAEWEGFWAATGHPRLRSPEAALVAWAQSRVARG